MSELMVQGIVLKEYYNGESNKTIVVLTKEHGKMLLNAKGARRTKSNLLAGTQLFCYGNFLVFDNRGFKSILQAELIESFYALRQDIEKLSYCAYLADLSDRVSMEGMESHDIVELLLRVFHILSTKEYTVKLAVRVFELKLLQFSGFTPEINHCIHCGEIVYQNMSIYTEGIVCEKCYYSKCISISIATVNCLQYVFDSTMKALFRFQVSETVLEELGQVTKLFMKAHMDVNLKSLEFAENLSI